MITICSGYIDENERQVFCDKLLSVTCNEGHVYKISEPYDLELMRMYVDSHPRCIVMRNGGYAFRCRAIINTSEVSHGLCRLCKEKALRTVHAMNS